MWSNKASYIYGINIFLFLKTYADELILPNSLNNNSYGLNIIGLSKYAHICMIHVTFAKFSNILVL